MSLPWSDLEKGDEGSYLPHRQTIVDIAVQEQPILF